MSVLKNGLCTLSYIVCLAAEYFTSCEYIKYLNTVCTYFKKNRTLYKLFFDWCNIKLFFKKRGKKWNSDPIILDL